MSTDPTDCADPLSAAMDLFWERGFVATSLSDLLHRMKVSRKRIYSTYGSKEALFQAVLKAYVESQAKPRMACLEGDKKGLEAIESYLGSWKFGPHFRGCLLWNSAAESENLTPESMAIVQEHFSHLETALCENFSVAKSKGAIESTASDHELAHQLLSTVMGLSVMGKLVQDPASSENTVRLTLSCMGAKLDRTRAATAC